MQCAPSSTLRSTTPSIDVPNAVPLFLADSREATPHDPYNEDSDAPPTKRRRFESLTPDRSDSEDEVDESEDEETLSLAQYKRSFTRSARRNPTEISVRRFFDLEAVVDREEHTSDEESEDDRDFLDDTEQQSTRLQPFVREPKTSVDGIGSLEDDLHALKQRAVRYRQQVRIELGDIGTRNEHADDGGLELVLALKARPRDIDSFRVARIEEFEGRAPACPPAPKIAATQNSDHHNARALVAYRAANHPPPPKRSVLPFWLELAAIEAKHTLEKGQWVRVGWGKFKGRLAFVINTNAIYLPGRKPPIFHLAKPRHTVQLVKPPTLEECRALDIYPHQALLRIASHEEFAPFASSHHVELRRLVGSARGPPLRPGDRVVVVTGRLRGQSGYLAGIHVSGVGATSKHIARVVPAYKGHYDPYIAEDGIFPEMQDLRRHLLDFSYVLSVGDRVHFVEGGVDCVEGRVHALDAKNDIVLFKNQNGAIYDPCTVDQLTRVWQEGDFVRVRCGAHQRRSGSVMTVNSCLGLVELFDLNRLESNRISKQWQDGRLFWVRACDVDFNHAGDVITFGVPASARKTNLLLLPQSVEQRVPYSTTFAPPHTAGVAHTLTAEDDEERLHPDVARHYIGLNVSYVAKGSLKGFRGTVVGVYNSGARELRLRSVEDEWTQKLRSLAQDYYPAVPMNDSVLNNLKIRGRDALAQADNDHEGLLLTLRRTGGADVVQDVPIEKVVHHWTMVPLLNTRAMPHEVLRGHQHLITPELKFAAFPPQSPPPRARTPCPSPSSPPFEVPPELEGETTGEWICVPGISYKRLDVVVQGVADEPALSAKVREMEGRRGYLLLDRGVPARDTSKIFSRSRKADKIDVYGLTVGGTKHPIDRRYLRPCRTGLDGRTLAEMVRRVVVVGADVGGDSSRRGCYGETDPLVAHSSCPNTVAVRFSFDQYSIFHFSSLCLSENVRVAAPHGVFDIFNPK
ncbi:hypothetical protein R3P38DRAFT_3219153 [Favolaschia claudopus]|uniref:Chromatin elongation factor spt5 n=1 Tax=Favolaschia claudopus TaxID=2862362 RepID=A0AAW0A281_9AGAR